MNFTQVTKGYSNWKDATVAFKRHEGSNCHREAVEVIITLPATTVHIGVQLSQQYAREMENNRTMLLSCIQFLAQQGLPLRGEDDESDGNFLQLLKFQGLDDDMMLEWLQRKCNKYTSHEIQNDLLKIMALHVLRSIADHLQKSPFLTVMKQLISPTKSKLLLSFEG